jgi:hypothetical protein
MGGCSMIDIRLDNVFDYRFQKVLIHHSLDKQVVPYINAYLTDIDPTVDHDEYDSAGIKIQFTQGKMWFNTVTNVFYVCTNSTKHNAVWVPLSGGGGPVPPHSHDWGTW